MYKNVVLLRKLHTVYMSSLEQCTNSLDKYIKTIIILYMFSLEQCIKMLYYQESQTLGHVLLWNSVPNDLANISYLLSFYSTCSHWNSVKKLPNNMTY